MNSSRFEKDKKVEDHKIIRFTRLLTSIVFNASNHTKCVSSSNQKCITQLNLIGLHPI